MLKLKLLDNDINDLLGVLEFTEILNVKIHLVISKFNVIILWSPIFDLNLIPWYCFPVC